jgi:hypothetical protein
MNTRQLLRTETRLTARSTGRIIPRPVIERPPEKPLTFFNPLPFERKKRRIESNSLFGKELFKGAYTPDVTALSLNIRGVMPNKRLVATGIVSRPKLR